MELDRKLDKAEIKKNLINKPAGMKMDDKHKYKINNIVNEAAVLKDCYYNENDVNTAIRRYMEPSQGDSIFHQDEVNQYLRETMADMGKNASIK